MQPQSYPWLSILMKYPPLNLMVIGQLEMVTLFLYTLLIKKCQFPLLGLYSKHTVQKILLATIV